MRQNRLMLPALLLAISCTAQAQVFWSVTDDEGRQNWLLGTVHSEDPRLLEFSEELLDAIKQGDRLALELVPDMAVLERLQQAMHFDNGGLNEVLEPSFTTRWFASWKMATAWANPPSGDCAPGPPR
jgi:uncharacterized protein